MLLEWIDQNGPAATSSNASDRKRVRSQAMKNFRSRQRRERQAAVTSALDRVARRSSKAPLRPKEQQPGPLTRDRKHSDAFNGPSRQAKKAIVQSSHVTASSRAPKAPTPGSIPRSPTQWNHDAFSSPAQLGQIIGFCASYLNQLRPSISFDHAASVITTAWNTSPCQMLLAACSLCAAGDMENSCQPEEIYKAQVLHELRERMQFQETATSDETISALMFLTSFELSRSNREACTHLYALRDVVKQRTADDTKTPLSQTMMLEVLDMVQAIMFENSPITEGFALIPQMSACEMSEKLSDLLKAEVLVYDGQACHENAVKLQGLDSLLGSAFASVQAIINNATMGGIIFNVFYETLEAFRKANCRDETHLSRNAQHVAREFYHQQAIFYNLVANGRPYRHASNGSHVAALRTAIQADDVQEPWPEMSFYRIMVLLTGLASSRESSHKAFFKARLVKAIYEMGLQQWPEVREFILMFLLGRDYLQFHVSRDAATSAIDVVSDSQSNTVVFESGRESSSWTPETDPSQDSPSLDSTPERSRAKHNLDRSRRVQQLLRADRGFHEVIRQGNCWLTEHT